MSETVAAHVAHGLALGGVLAIAGAWSLRSGGGALPHLGVGAVAGVAVALGGRLATVPSWVTVLLVLLAGAVCGRLAWSLDTRVRAVAGRPAVAADVAVLGAAVATVGLLVPVGAAPAVYPPLSAAVLPSGVPVLGGWPGLPAGLAALVLGGAAVWLLASWAPTATGERPGARRWAAAGAALAGAAVLGGGALVAGDAAARGAVLAAADPVGLAIRASAAALAGRGSTWRAAAAGLALGVAETLARVLDPTGAIVMLPAVAVVLVSVILAWDHRPDTPAAATGR